MATRSGVSRQIRTACSLAVTHPRERGITTARLRARTERLCTVPDFGPGGLGAISSSRCQTTRTRRGEPRAGANRCTSGRAASLPDAAPRKHARRRASGRMSGSSRSSGRRSGGARRDRTDDLLLAKQALSQLSYGPVRNRWSASRNQKRTDIRSPIPITTTDCRSPKTGGPGKI
jgi:hypothetical protein